MLIQHFPFHFAVQIEEFARAVLSSSFEFSIEAGTVRIVDAAFAFPLVPLELSLVLLSIFTQCPKSVLLIVHPFSCVQLLPCRVVVLSKPVSLVADEATHIVAPITIHHSPFLVRGSILPVPFVLLSVRPLCLPLALEHSCFEATLQDRPIFQSFNAGAILRPLMPASVEAISALPGNNALALAFPMEELPNIAGSIGLGVLSFSVLDIVLPHSIVDLSSGFLKDSLAVADSILEHAIVACPV